MVYYPFDIVEKKVWILDTLGRIARSYELYAGKKIFVTIPTVFALEGSTEKKLFEYGMRTPFVPIWDQINKE